MAGKAMTYVDFSAYLASTNLDMLTTMNCGLHGKYRMQTARK